MPLKLIEPRAGRSQNWRVRGTYLGVTVDRSTGSPEKAVARKLLLKWKAEIERGEFALKGELTFAAASLSYVQAGGEDRFVLPIATHFGDRKLAREIVQADVDACAVALYPDATPATRNRHVYTPVSAILKHAGIETKIRRPKGAQGETRTRWLQPKEAERLLSAAVSVDVEFSIFLTVLLCTGMRLGDALSLDCRSVDLSRGFLFVARTKNGLPRPVYLPPSGVAALASHPRGIERAERLFRFAKNGYLYTLMRNAKGRAGADLSWVTFHDLCHTWATWMRRFGGLDTRDLVATGRWEDEKSAARYAHVETSAVARQADLLPISWKARSV